MFILSLAVALVLSVALPVADAEAHTSSYCGHGQSGYSITTTWVQSWDDSYGRHWHKYEHRRWDIWRVHSDVWKRC